LAIGTGFYALSYSDVETGTQLIKRRIVNARSSYRMEMYRALLRTNVVCVVYVWYRQKPEAV
jgi:hypothetical protein